MIRLIVEDFLLLINRLCIFDDAYYYGKLCKFFYLNELMNEIIFELISNIIHTNLSIHKLNMPKTCFSCNTLKI